MTKAEKKKLKKLTDIQGFTDRCPYCGGKVVLRNSSYVYKNKNKSYGKVWVCENFPQCNSYVGCHPNTQVPLGRLANPTLRSAKMKAHLEFDKLWKSGYMTRHSAYEWLAVMLGIPFEYCHIGMFDIKMCLKVINICKRQSITVKKR